VVVALAASGLTACTSTVVETTDTEAAGQSTTVVTVDRSGSRQELLAQLDAELQALSERIIERQGDAEALERIGALWAALKPGVTAEHPELVTGFQAVVDLAGSAVARRRPADADKARLNAEVLVVAAGS
jgi:hypothetical protein